MTNQNPKTLPNDNVADAIYDLSKSLRLLGKGNIARSDTDPGAIESLSMALIEASKNIASSLDGIANAIHALADSERSK